MKDTNYNDRPDLDPVADDNSSEDTKSVPEVNGKNDDNSINNVNNNYVKLNEVGKDSHADKNETYQNGKDEIDNISAEVQDTGSNDEELETHCGDTSAPKYKYSYDQWSPLNVSGKKCYDIGLLMQIKEDPLSKRKPNIPLLETCNVIRTAPIEEPVTFNIISRPITINSLLPNYAKSTAVQQSSPKRPLTPRGHKKDGRIMSQTGKGSVKLAAPYISISLSRDEVQLNQTKNAWKPSRLLKESMTEEDAKTEDLYKQFRGILNKLTPQKFDALMTKVKGLEINTEARLEGVIDLVFEKALIEPKFSEAYAAMCSKLSMIKVPSVKNPDQCVNFRALILSKCQNQFMTKKVDENVLRLEGELALCTGADKRKELQDQLSEETRRVRMRSVGNVMFIGELYKLKMLTPKIIVYCMIYLIDKMEEEKLECLCKLLTTIGAQLEKEAKEQLENVVKRMQHIVDRHADTISSRVRFMLQDVIDLKRVMWVAKDVVDSRPKMMVQIQKEAEQQQRNIELMNSGPNPSRRDDRRGKRTGDVRRQESSLTENQRRSTPRVSYTVDTSKLKAVTHKNLNNIKLAPPSWGLGSGAKKTVEVRSGSVINITKNRFSVLEDVPGDETSLSSNDVSSRSVSSGAPRSMSGSRSAASPEPEPSPPSRAPLPEAKQRALKTIVLDNLNNPNEEEFASDFKQTCPEQYHSAAITEMLNIAFSRPPKDVEIIAKAMCHLISMNTVSNEEFLSGLSEILEFAPDLYIDVPMLYDYLSKFVAPLIENKNVIFVQIFRLSKTLIESNHGRFLLKSIFRDLKDALGPSFVKKKWQESGLELGQWMCEESVLKWTKDNEFQFLEAGRVDDDTKRSLTPSETQTKLLQLMNTCDDADSIRRWVQDNVGESSKESWFMGALVQATCEHALRSWQRMSQFAALLGEYGEARERTEAVSLANVRQLMHTLQHPQGVELKIYKFLLEHNVISVDGLAAWEENVHSDI